MNECCYDGSSQSELIYPTVCLTQRYSPLVGTIADLMFENSD